MKQDAAVCQIWASLCLKSNYVMKFSDNAHGTTEAARGQYWIFIPSKCEWGSLKKYTNYPSQRVDVCAVRPLVVKRAYCCCRLLWKARCRIILRKAMPRLYYRCNRGDPAWDIQNLLQWGWFQMSTIEEKISGRKYGHPTNLMLAVNWIPNVFVRT